MAPHHTDPQAFEAAHPAPSTYDLFAPMGFSGAQDDVEFILESALARYKEGATPNAYVDGVGGAVCAGGAMMTAVVEAKATMDGWEDEDEVVHDIGYHSVADIFEKRAADSAKEALRLVNEAAGEIILAGEFGCDDYFPQGSFDDGSGEKTLDEWVAKGCGYPFGTVEALNQMLPFTTRREMEGEEPDEDGYYPGPAQLAVREAYRRAIQKRRQLTLATV